MNDNDKHAASAQRASIISSIIAYFNAVSEGSINSGDIDERAQVGEMLDQMINEIEPDKTSWGKTDGTMLYDVYLQMREAEGTITDTDLVRSGLTSALFADAAEYYKHCQRISNHRAQTTVEESEYGKTKVCASCGEEKPVSKFKRRGGAKCNTCRSREYRNRMKEK
jgi:translation initiation factor 2 beta subunit (eIF-2beta)/eIF-5